MPLPGSCIQLLLNTATPSVLSFEKNNATHIIPGVSQREAQPLCLSITKVYKIETRYGNWLDTIGDTSKYFDINNHDILLGNKLSLHLYYKGYHFAGGSEVQRYYHHQHVCSLDV